MLSSSSICHLVPASAACGLHHPLCADPGSAGVRRVRPWPPPSTTDWTDYNFAKNRHWLRDHFEHLRKTGRTHTTRRVVHSWSGHADAPTGEHQLAVTREPASPRHCCPSLRLSAPASHTTLGASACCCCRHNPAFHPPIIGYTTDDKCMQLICSRR